MRLKRILNGVGGLVASCSVAFSAAVAAADETFDRLAESPWITAGLAGAENDRVVEFSSELYSRKDFVKPVADRDSGFATIYIAANGFYELYVNSNRVETLTATSFMPHIGVGGKTVYVDTHKVPVAYFESRDRFGRKLARQPVVSVRMMPVRQGEAPGFAMAVIGSIPIEWRWGFTEYVSAAFARGVTLDRTRRLSDVGHLTVKGNLIGVKLLADDSPPNVFGRTLVGKSRWITDGVEQEIDFGESVGGAPQLDFVECRRGERIVIDYGNGGEDVYVCAGEPRERFAPSFSFHEARTIRVRGIDYLLREGEAKWREIVPSSLARPLPEGVTQSERNRFALAAVLNHHSDIVRSYAKFSVVYPLGTLSFRLLNDLLDAIDARGDSKLVDQDLHMLEILYDHAWKRERNTRVRPLLDTIERLLRRDR